MFSLFFSLFLATVSSVSFAAQSEDSLPEISQKTRIVCPLNDGIATRVYAQFYPTMFVQDIAITVQNDFASLLREANKDRIKRQYDDLLYGDFVALLQNAGKSIERQKYAA